LDERYNRVVRLGDTWYLWRLLKIDVS